MRQSEKRTAGVARTRIAAAIPGAVAALGALLVGPALARAEKPAPIIDAANLEPEATGAWIGKAKGNASHEAATRVLKHGHRTRRWSGAARKALRGREEAVSVRYRIGWGEPRSVGAVRVVGTPERVAILKPEAPYPGDPHNPDHWREIDAPHATGRSHLIPLPDGVRARALLLRDEAKRQSRIWRIGLYGPRWHDVAPAAHAYGEHDEWGDAPEDVPRGGQWRNTGENEKGRHTRAPVSDVEPSHFILAWEAPRKIHGLWYEGWIAGVTVERFVGPKGLNPRVGTDAEWKRVRRVKATRDRGLGARCGWLWFHEPVRTRGLRLVIKDTAADEPSVTGLDAIEAWSRLGSRPVPETDAPSKKEKRKQRALPVSISLDLPKTGKTSLVINGPNGRRVRNFFTRREKEGGAHEIPWNLRNDQGQYVSAGTYRWKAIWHPGLELRYRASVYPNVTQHHSDRAAWLAGRHGPHGWLADHSPPKAVTVAGDRVYIGAPVSEAGIQLLEANLDGKKLWGQGNWAGFTGTWRLAGDEEAVFSLAKMHNAAEGKGIDPKSEGVWVIDPETHEVKGPLVLEPTPNRLRGMAGAVARDGTLYLAVNAKENRLRSPVGPSAVDIAHAVPRYKPKRDPRYKYEVVPDPRGDFLRLFRLTGDPPGYAPDHGLTWLESTKGPEPAQHIVLPFKRPVAIGGAIYPVPKHEKYEVRLSALKKDAPYPPDPRAADHWKPFKTHGKAPWDVARAPRGLKTRALRISFMKGGTDEISRTLMGGSGGADEGISLEEDGGAAFGGGEAWRGRLEGMKLFRRRFANRAPEAEVWVNSGTYNEKRMVWDAERPDDRPLSRSDPAVMVLSWDEKKKLRGLGIKEIDGAVTLIDVYEGPEGSIRSGEMTGWRQIARYEQERRRLHPNMENHNAHARYMDGYVDFGETVRTRAVRLRVVRQWTDNGSTGDLGVRADRAGTKIDPTRCHVYGVAALSPLEGEPPVDPLIADRIEVIDAEKRKVVRELPARAAHGLALDEQGRLVTHDGERFLRLDRRSGEVLERFELAVKKPGPFCIGPEGRICVFDRAEDRRTVRVFSPEGKLEKTLGTPGGQKVGRWDPTRFGKVSALAVDRRGQLWAVEYQQWPKRVAVWNLEQGTFLREHLGNTRYGGGGALDRWDPSRLVYGPLEFEVNLETGESELKALTHKPGAQGYPAEAGRPIHANGRIYMVSRPPLSGPWQGVGVVYRYDPESASCSLAAAVGKASAFKPLQRPELHEKLGLPRLKKHRFRFTDENGNGRVEAAEVALTRGSTRVVQFQRDLSIFAEEGGLWRVERFLDNGAPVYRWEAREYVKSATFAHRDGSVHRMGGDVTKTGRERGFAADGTRQWSYPVGGIGVQALHHADPWSPSQVVAQMGFVGHERTRQGELGEFLVTNANHGGWYLWTADGIPAANVFHDGRSPGARTWHMPEHARGMDLGKLTVGREHFSGHFARTPEGRYYAVAGHTHVSVVEVKGLKKFQRFSGTLDVSGSDVSETLQIMRAREAEKSYERARVADAHQLERAPELDGRLEDLPRAAAFGKRGKIGREIVRGAVLHIGHTDKHLYVGLEVRGMGPLKNTPDRSWQSLFRTGAAVDLKIGGDPDAPADRRKPAAGDKRLLITRNRKGAPIAVLYEPDAPDAPESASWQAKSPVHQVSFDRVVRVADRIRMAHRDTGKGYVVEAALPLSLLELSPDPGHRVRFDFGVLRTDESATRTIGRTYWSNQAAASLGDIPMEASLHPRQWGHLRFRGPREGSSASPSSEKTLKEKSGGGGEEVDRFLDDMAEE